LLGVFERDSDILRSYVMNLHRCCNRVLTAQVVCCLSSCSVVGDKQVDLQITILILSLCLQVRQSDHYSPGLPVHQLNYPVCLTHAQSKFKVLILLN